MMVWRGGIVAALAVVLSGSAWAAEKAAKPRYVWPTEAEMRAALSPAAAARSGEARAILLCRLDDSGAMAECRVAYETPAGLGIGAAAMALTKKMRFPAPKPNEARDVVLPIDWFEMDVAPDWRRRPTAEDLLGVWPPGALEKAQSGKATIACVATTEGALVDCVVTSESPAGGGFGAAAIALTPQFMMRPATLKGVPVRSSVRIPINFDASNLKPGVAWTRKVASPAIAWAEAPTFADVAAAYPESAAKAGLSGRATLYCDVVAKTGRLQNCETISAEPKGVGFETAAKSLAKKFRFVPVNAAEAETLKRLSVQLPFTFTSGMLIEGAAVVGKPVWAGLPDGVRMRDAFGRLGLKGTLRAVLQCTVQPGGGVGECRVASESPVGAGVGQVALGLTDQIRLTTWTNDGLPVVGGSVRIPIRYEEGAATASQ